MNSFLADWVRDGRGALNRMMTFLFKLLIAISFGFLMVALL